MLDVTIVIEMLIALIGGLITVFVIPFIRSKTTASHLEQLRSFAKIAVHAAEQLNNAGVLDFPKFDYAYERVLDYLNKNGITFDVETIKAAIEGEVLNLKN